MIPGCLPAVAGSALFIALLIMDVVNRDYERLPGHILVALFALVVFLYLCQRGFDFAAWAIFSIPFVIVGLGWATAEIRKA